LFELVVIQASEDLKNISRSAEFAELTGKRKYMGRS